jgi:hypothetical protein
MPFLPARHADSASAGSAGGWPASIGDGQRYIRECMFGLVIANGIDGCGPIAADAVADGFLAELVEQAPAASGLADSILTVAGDIAARHCARFGGAPDVSAAAVALAAYRVLAGALPAAELRRLLRDCWERGLRDQRRADRRARAGASPDPFGEMASVSGWRGVCAMFFCVAGLSGPYFWLVEQGDRGAELLAARSRLSSELFAAEGAPELTRLLFAADRC